MVSRFVGYERMTQWRFTEKTIEIDELIGLVCTVRAGNCPGGRILTEVYIYVCLTIDSSIDALTT